MGDTRTSSRMSQRLSREYECISLHQLLLSVSVRVNRFYELAKGFAREHYVASVFSIITEISDGFGVRIRRIIRKISKLLPWRSSHSFPPQKAFPVRL